MIDLSIKKAAMAAKRVSPIRSNQPIKIKIDIGTQLAAFAEAEMSRLYALIPDADPEIRIFALESIKQIREKVFSSLNAEELSNRMMAVLAGETDLVIDENTPNPVDEES